MLLLNSHHPGDGLGQKTISIRYESNAFYIIDNNRLAKVLLFPELAKKSFKNLHCAVYVGMVSHHGC